VAASDSFTPLTNLPGITTTANSDTLPALFNNLYKLCIGAAAVIAILQIMRAGTYFFFNKGSVAHNEKAKGLISNSVLGLLLVLSPAIVFGIINPDILKLNLDISRLKTSFTPPAPTRPDLRNETFSQERQNQLFCEEFRKPGHRVQAVPFQGTNRNECQRIEGSNKGWMSIPTGCCSNVPSQGICCGYDPDQDGRLLNPPTGGGTGEFFINYVFSDRESQDDNPNTRCKAQDRQQYETLEACTQALYPPAAVIACVSGTNGSSVPCYSSKVHNCNAAKTSVYLPDRAAFDRINALTTCLYE
jgi:hypothetical protein